MSDKDVKRCVLIAHGDMNDLIWHKAQIRDTDFIVCADGGTEYALLMGRVPDIVLGDFDSLATDVKSFLAGKDCQISTYPREKDMTDTELALKCCLDLQPEEIVLMGTIGTRIDHSLSNILLLLGVPDKVKVKVINEHNEIMLLRKKISFTGSPGDLVSIIPLSNELKGVSTRGLKYMLCDDSIFWGTSRGVSNEMVDSEGLIEVKEGIALVIKAWDKPRINSI
ncbi:MAG: thiamine diphosphokinase [Dehalobacterium sp.]